MGPLYLKKKNGSFKLPHEHGSGAGRVVGSKFLARARPAVRSDSVFLSCTFRVMSGWWSFFLV